MKDSAGAECVGEVVAAGTGGFTAQCPRALLHRPPAFGAFVRILQSLPAAAPTAPAPTAAVFDPFADTVPAVRALPDGIPDETLYAVVYSAGTSSAEPGRRPGAYGLSETELQAQQPQIFDLLATEFSALHIGYVRGGRFHPGVPPRPARLHAPVSDCSPDEICALTERPEILRALVKASSEVPIDDLIVACMQSAYTCRGDDYPYLVRAGKQLAGLLRDEPDRLSAILARLEP